MLVSCVMPTWRRFNCVERAIAGFLAQRTSLDTELIILNTDVDYPLELDFVDTRIKIINTNCDQYTGVGYTSTGAIRRDATALASGDLYMTWDDDDIYWPWHIEQCWQGLQRTQKLAWKPRESFMWVKDTPELAYNYLEATVMMYMKEATFNLNSGPEGLSWFDRLKSQDQLVEDPDSIPSYCFYWKDPSDQGGHKQSDMRTWQQVDVFELHKSQCKDIASKPLTYRNLKYYNTIYDKFIPLWQQLETTHTEYMKRFYKDYASMAG